MGKRRTSIWLVIAAAAASILFAVIVGVWSYAHAVPRLYSDPANVPSTIEGSPPPAWAEAVEKGRQIARAGVAEQNLPGVSVAVGIGTAIVWTEGFGWADLATHVPVSPDLRFRIGHVSKSLTSAGVGLLRDKEQLHLDDEIQTYVPEYPKKPWPVTLRQLMGHTAGIKHYSGEEADIPSGHCERASDALSSFADDPLLFQPGTRSSYSTYGWVLVSAAVEAAAHEPFFSFMRSQIFTPLGMSGTTVDSGNAPMPDRATFYFPRFSGENTSGQAVARTADYSCFAGAGAFLSTPADLVRFGIALGNGTLLKPGTVKMLQTNHQLDSGQDTEFGLGWTVETVELAGERTRLVSDASKSLLGASTSFLIFPERGLVVAVASNTSYAGTRAIALSIAGAFAASVPHRMP